MSTDNLFPDHPSPKKHITLQQRLLDYIREHKVITEEIYREKIGGKSVSAALHNIKRRGLLEPGEYILPDKMVGTHGASLPAYRLVKESPVEDIPNEEPETENIPEWPEVGEVEEPPVPEYDTPEVSSILVGVNKYQPELIIMFKGDFKPLRHVMNQMEVRYLMTNLLPFMPTPKE